MLHSPFLFLPNKAVCSLLQLACHHKLDMFIPSHLVHHFLIPIGFRFRVTQYLCLWYHSSLYTMQELSYLCRFTLVSICYRMLLTQIITRVYKDSLTLTYPPNINIWLVLQFWYPHVGSLIPLCWLLIPCIHMYTGPTLGWYKEHSILVR